MKNEVSVLTEYRCCLLIWLLYVFVFSGYDFGYMVKLLTDSRLPEEEHEFFHILNLFFPSIYDVKYLMKSCKNLKVLVYAQQASRGWVSILYVYSKPIDRTAAYMKS